MRCHSLGGRTIGRRRFLAEGSIGLLGASTVLGAFGRTALGESQFIEVETSCGRVRGAQADGLVTFKGIPYAGSVSGRNERILEHVRPHRPARCARAACLACVHDRAASHDVHRRAVPSGERSLQSRTAGLGFDLGHAARRYRGRHRAARSALTSRPRAQVRTADLAHRSPYRLAHGGRHEVNLSSLGHR